VLPKDKAKILGVVMDSELRYREHIVYAATNSLNAALVLRRLKMLSPQTARQLFGATVAPAMDYALSVWMHAGKGSIKAMERAQRIGAQAIVGSFQTVALVIAEAEAHIQPIHQRHQERAAKLWIGLQTLPESHPLRKLIGRIFRRFTSPLQRIAQVHQQYDIETILAFPILPWEERIKVIVELDCEKAAQIARNTENTKAVLVATSLSEKEGTVGAGGAIRDTTMIAFPPNIDPVASYSVTLGLREKFNRYVTELTAISTALQNLVGYLRNRTLTILSSNLAALLAIKRPKHQSGQYILC
jgi:hypothetical protein